MRQDTILVAFRAESISVVQKKLRDYGIDTFCAEDIDSVKAGLALRRPAFLLLDFDIEGTESFLAEIVFEHHYPQPFIIVASSYIDGAARAAMLTRGADACVDKPINEMEVLAVIRAVLRRMRYNLLCQHYNYRLEIKYRELMLDPIHRVVTMRGKHISLTRKEYEVLYFLAKNIGTVFTKEEIYFAVWKEKYNPQSTNVSDQISSLRRKLGLDRKDAEYIQTVVGVGYRFGTFM